MSDGETAGQLLERLGDDAQSWADEFIKVTKCDIDREWVMGWFANAIEHSYLVKKRRELEQVKKCAECSAVLGKNWWSNVPGRGDLCQACHGGAK